MFPQVLAVNPKHLQAAHKLIETTYGKVSITRPIPAGAWIPVGVAGLLWILLGTLVAGGLLWSVLGRSIFDWVRGEASLGWLAVESLIVLVVALAALVGITVTLWARWALDLTFRVEARDNRSVWRALLAHLPFGLGLFYANRLAWRRWVYPFLALLLPVVLLISPLLLAAPFDYAREYSPDFFKFYENGTVFIGEIKRGSAEDDAASWNIALWVAGGAYLLSLADVLVTCALKRGKTRQATSVTQVSKPVAFGGSMKSAAAEGVQKLPPFVISGLLSAIVWLPLLVCLVWVASEDRFNEIVKYGLYFAILAAWLAPLFLAQSGRINGKTLWLVFFAFIAIMQAVVFGISKEMDDQQMNSLLDLLFWGGLALGFVLFYALPVSKTWWKVELFKAKQEPDWQSAKYALPALASAALALSVLIRMSTLGQEGDAWLKSTLPLATGLLGFLILGLIVQRRNGSYTWLLIGLATWLIPLPSFLVRWGESDEFPNTLITLDAFLIGTSALLVALALIALGVFKLDIYYFLRAKLGKRKNDTARS
jgi:hypothetical protein